MGLLGIGVPESESVAAAAAVVAGSEAQAAAAAHAPAEATHSAAGVHGAGGGQTVAARPSASERVTAINDTWMPTQKRRKHMAEYEEEIPKKRGNFLQFGIPSACRLLLVNLPLAHGAYVQRCAYAT